MSRLVGLEAILPGFKNLNYQIMIFYNLDESSCAFSLAKNM
jgi:hypothetical protein